MLERFASADRWLTRIYDPQRSDEHRKAIWDFVTQHADPKLSRLVRATRQLDEYTVNYWDTHGRN